MPWIVVTAIVVAGTDDKPAKTRPMRMNFDNVVSYGPAAGSPCVIMCTDGQVYPISETPEQIDAVLGMATGHGVTTLTSYGSKTRKK